MDYFFIGNVKKSLGLSMIEFNSWVIPFTFIPGVGMLILSTANRLSYVSSLIREIITSENHIYRENIEQLVYRTRYFYRALISFYIAIVLLAMSALTGIAHIIFLKDNVLFYNHIINVITGIGIISVILGALFLIQESIIAVKLVLNCKDTKKMIVEIKRDND